MKNKLLLTAIASIGLAACGGDSSAVPPVATDASEINIINASKVLETNADIAYAGYTDSVGTAVALKNALIEFRADPTLIKLNAAKNAWLVSREPYGQTEVYRFRLSPIDSTDYSSEDGPEGDINAWPLGEALIDYVITGGDFGNDEIGVITNNAGVNNNGAVNTTNNAGNNIIAQTGITIDNALVSNNATAEDEHDVIAGYHAIEFLLWGQDLNNTAAVTNGDDREDAVKTKNANNLAAGGQRPVTDFQPGYDSTTTTYDSTELSHRRHKYLEVVVDKLITDLTQVRDAWAPSASYRTAFTTVTTEAQARQKLQEILTGMGTLSEGELAGERMQISFSANSQEDEHSCFSDNTHRDIWLNAEGVSNSYYGVYQGYDSDLDGSDDQTTDAINGYGIDDYIADSGNSTLQGFATQLEAAFSTTESNYTDIDTQARAGTPVDVQIMDINRNANNPMFATIISLNEQSALIAKIAETFGITDTVVDDDASGCNTTEPDTSCN